MNEMRWLVCVLFHNGSGDPISNECRERLLAARELVASKGDLTVELTCVGGGGLTPSGAERLAIFQSGMPDFPDDIKRTILGNSNTTVSNIEEIEKYASLINADKVIIVTHAYHAARVLKILCSKALLWDIVTVESQISRETPTLLSRIVIWFCEQLLTLLLPVDRPFFQPLRKFFYSKR